MPAKPTATPTAASNLVDVAGQKQGALIKSYVISDFEADSPWASTTPGTLRDPTHELVQSRIRRKPHVRFPGR